VLSRDLPGVIVKNSIFCILSRPGLYRFGPDLNSLFWPKSHFWSVSLSSLSSYKCLLEFLLDFGSFSASFNTNICCLKYHLKLLILGHFLKLLILRYFLKVTRLNQNELIFCNYLVLNFLNIKNIQVSYYLIQPRAHLSSV
jgi:hypothetical protein